MKYFIFDLSVINYQTLYYILDIILKIVLGIIVVIYVNKRNNNIKKKEILYDLVLDIIKDMQILKSSRTNAFYYTCFRGYEYRTADTTFEIYRNEVYEVCAEKYKHDYDEFMKSMYSFDRISETIELILGVQNKKWKLLQLELKTLLFYFGARKIVSNKKSILLVYNDTWQTAQSEFEEECDGLVKVKFDGFLSEREMYKEIEDKLFTILYHRYYKQYDTNIDKLMDEFKKTIKNKIDKL